MCVFCRSYGRGASSRILSRTQWLDALYYFVTVASKMEPD